MAAKIRAGLYEYTDKHGQLWIIEHVSPSSGFTYDEWHYGTESDPHADQANTKHECLVSIAAWEDDTYYVEECDTNDGELSFYGVEEGEEFTKEQALAFAKNKQVSDGAFIRVWREGHEPNEDYIYERWGETFENSRDK